MASSRSLTDLVHSFEFSSYRENLFEQIFVAELLQACWLAGLPLLEVDRPFVDYQGYDLVASSGGVSRHIQLKASKGRVAVHRALAAKPSGCVVLLQAQADEAARRIVFSYRFFGEGPGKALDLKAEFKAARKPFHTKNETGAFIKAERQHHVVVPAGYFSAPMDVIELVKRLFGERDVGASGTS